MIHQHELKAEDVRAYALTILKKHLRIEANGYCCKTDMIYDVLMKASAECSSLEAVCSSLEDVADSNTLREYVNQALLSDELSAQEEQVNLALAECIPTSMVRQRIEVAIDYHDEPFYGKQEQTRAELVQDKPRKARHISSGLQPLMSFGVKSG